MKLKPLLIACACSAALPAISQAAQLQVVISNLTHAQTFTPRLLVAHDASRDLFQAGTNASSALAWLAEAGVISDGDNSASVGRNFEALLGPADTDNTDNRWHQFGGLLPPSTTSAVYNFDSSDFEYLSLLTMLVPTNDAFAGLDSIRIPTEPGTYTYDLNAYDAGTELNDELNSTRTDITEEGTGLSLGGYAVPGVAGVGASPVPLGTAGTGVGIQIGVGVDGSPIGLTEVADGTDGPIHIHRNVLGDTNATGGASDLGSTVHRWLNPVARLTITVSGS